MAYGRTRRLEKISAGKADHVIDADQARGGVPPATQPAHAYEPVQHGRTCIETINGPFLLELKGTPAEYKPGWSVFERTGHRFGEENASNCNPELQF
jgi:hypothetical protein